MTLYCVKMVIMGDETWKTVETVEREGRRFRGRGETVEREGRRFRGRGEKVER